MKTVIVDGLVFRWRRGRLVPIPAEWLGKVATRQTIRKRPSKQTRKTRTAPTRHSHGRVLRYFDLDRTRDRALCDLED